MDRLKKFLSFTAWHFFLLCMGLITSLLINVLYDDNQGLSNAAFGSDEQKFYRLLTEYALQLNLPRHDSEFREGMDDASRQQFENLLNTIRYKENCTQHKSTTIDNANNCVVNGQLIDYIEHSK